MRYKKQLLVIVSLATLLFFIQCSKSFERSGNEDLSLNSSENQSLNEKSFINDGKQTFRFDTYGDEEFWSGLLHIDKAIAGANNGGFGAGVSPNTALAVGLKVDVQALPPDVIAGILSGEIDLNDPATTITLLQLNSVVGVKGN